MRGDGHVAFDGLADVVARCGLPVVGAESASGPGRLGSALGTGGRWSGGGSEKPRRTRAGVRRAGRAGFSQGRRRSSASGRARRSWVWAAMTRQVQRSAASGVRIFGRPGDPLRQAAVADVPGVDIIDVGSRPLHRPDVTNQEQTATTLQ
jgi:hypothetical protein